MSNSNARRQANINAKKFDQLMKDIEKDVGRRTINTKKLDVALDKLGIYINNNPFTIGGVKHAEITKLLENIMGQAKFKGLARGGTAELVKGVISENTMHYVTRMGNDMKNNLRKIAVDSYNNKLAPQDIAKKLQKEVQGLSKTRAKSIARTETMRANNLSNLVNAKLNMGAKSYKVISASDCCERCDRIYKNGGVWFDINDLTYFPPLHPNCRCVVVYSTRTAAENNAREGNDITTKEKPKNLNKIKNENSDKNLERLYPEKGETYKNNRRKLVEKLSETNDFKEYNKLSNKNLSQKQINQNLKYYKEINVEKNVATKMESKIQKIANGKVEHSYSFDLKGNKLQHFVGNESSVKPAQGAYGWHNHPIGGTGAGAIPSNGARQSLRGDMSVFINDLEGEAWFGSSGRLISGVAHGNQRIFIIGDSKKYNIQLESLSSKGKNGLGTLTNKWKKLVDNLQQDFFHVNNVRISKGLKPISSTEFALEYENMMYKEFNKVAKDYGVEIVKWIL